MTDKQQIFADEYLKDLNGTRAYKVAYPNVKKDSVAAANASKLLRNAKVKSYIEEQLEKMHNERVADSQEVLEFLTSVMRDEQEEETLIGVGKGAQDVIAMKLPGNARIKAAELLGKRYQLFTDKLQDKGESDAQIASEKYDELIRETAKARLDLQASAGNE